MGLALEMKPNYEDFSCQFAFGRTPPSEDTDPAFATPCFMQCPTAARVGGGAGSSSKGGGGGQPLCPKVVPRAT